MRAFKALRVFSEERLRVGQQSIVPRDIYHTLLAPQIAADEILDICVIRVIGKGTNDGSEATVTIDLIDTFDAETGFTAMERLTGWHCAIMMGIQARGIIPPGGVPLEIAVPPMDFMEEFKKRGIKFTIQWE